ncbi:MAG: EAL domain-containing protein [Gammaproteobacteria bacterium]
MNRNFIRFAYCLLVLLAGIGTSLARADTKRVLVLNSYHEGYHWTDRIMGGIHSVMDPQRDVELFIHYMDAKRVSDETQIQLLHDLLKHEYQSQKMDIIIGTDDHALDFLLKYRDELFPGVPVIFNGINDYHPARIAGHPWFTGLAETYDIPGTLDLMLRLHPGTHEIAVVSDATGAGNDFRALVEQAEPRYSSRVRFNYLTNLAKEELRQALDRLPADALVLWVTYLRTPDGLSISSRDSVQFIANAAKVPTYCVYDVVGLGVVGGKVTSPTLQGSTAAEMALRVLHGEPIANIPVGHTPLVYLFDYNAMRRFGIREATLPKESVVLNRPQSSYEKYKRIVWSLLAFLLVAVGIILALTYYIRKRRQAEQALQASEERFRALYYDNPSMFFTIDPDGTVVSVNSYGAEQLGYSMDELVGNSVLGVFFDEDKAKALGYVRTCVAEPEKIHRWSLRKVRKDGTMLWVREAARLVHDADGKPLVLIVCEDITESYELAEKLTYQASHDALTGLVNRREFERRAGQLLSTITLEKDEHALCFMDLDQFKVINDTCGHMAGDEMLRQLTGVLQASIRQRDTLARLGGDEFGIIIEHCTLAHAQRVASTIQQAIQDYQFLWEGHSFKVGVSMGLVAMTKATSSLGGLLMEADAACYIAKEMGRNRIHVYHTKDSEIAKRHGEMQWVTRIHHALDTGKLMLFAQPIISLDGGADRHYELLLRMKDEDGKTVPPGAFLPAAERYNLISRLDRWVIEKTFALLVDNPAFLNQISFCALNISGQSLADDSFQSFVVTALAKSGIAGEKICFEITETAAISNLNVATTFISAMKSKGCRFALDDFGSGLSSFGYLKSLPVDYLKIDGIFVRDIVDDPIDHAMVKSINDIGHVMGMKTIAEFVENDVVVGMLRAIGVNYAQGYGVGEPRPFEELLGRARNVVSFSHTGGDAGR